MLRTTITARPLRGLSARYFSAAPATSESASDSPAAAEGSHANLPWVHPLSETNFIMNEVFDAESHYRKVAAQLAPEAGGGGDPVEPVTADMLDAINVECAKFAQEVVAPLYGPGDTACKYMPNGDVITPKGYRESYQEFSGEIFFS